MPRIADNLEQLKLPTSNYGYSGVRPDTLSATDYTTVTVCFDESGSVNSFKDDLTKCLKEVVQSCKYSPRADNLLLRVVCFGSTMREFHGFKLLQDCNESDYDDAFKDGGMTALFDTCQNSLEAMNAYCKGLLSQDYNVNGLLVCITDGDDNSSAFGMSEVKKEMEKAVSGENMESLLSILVAVNPNKNPSITRYLDNFHKNAGFSQFVLLEDAGSKTLAKLAKFVSKSITSSSVALGSGKASQPINMTF